MCDEDGGLLEDGRSLKDGLDELFPDISNADISGLLWSCTTFPSGSADDIYQQLKSIRQKVDTIKGGPEWGFDSNGLPNTDVEQAMTIIYAELDKFMKEISDD